jgi:hypothetical protein
MEEAHVSRTSNGRFREHDTALSERARINAITWVLERMIADRKEREDAEARNGGDKTEPEGSLDDGD